MKQKTIRIIAILAILSLLLQTSRTQARPILASSEAPSQKIKSTVDQLLPEGLTNSEWQSIQNQITANLSQQAYLKASNTGIKDYFSWSVAISGDTLVVGAYAEASKATDVNGDETDNSASYAGAAYVFVRSGDTWSQQAYLKASNTGINDYFGVSVAISGDTIVVGAPYESSDAEGVNEDQYNNNAKSSGAAYVFDVNNYLFLPLITK